MSHPLIHFEIGNPGWQQFITDIPCTSGHWIYSKQNISIKSSKLTSKTTKCELIVMEKGSFVASMKMDVYILLCIVQAFTLETKRSEISNFSSFHFSKKIFSSYRLIWFLLLGRIIIKESTLLIHDFCIPGKTNRKWSEGNSPYQYTRKTLHCRSKRSHNFTRWTIKCNADP